MLNQRVRRELPTDFRVRQAPTGRPCAAPDLRDVARLAARLSPFVGDPERFFLHREEVVTRLHALADALEAAR
jgi:hypothetical protein